MHPFGQLIFFFCMVLTGMGLASGMGLAALATAFGHTTAQAIGFASDATSSEGKVYNLIINGVNQVLSFGLMAWLASKLFGLHLPRIALAQSRLDCGRNGIGMGRPTLDRFDLSLERTGASSLARKLGSKCGPL